MELSGTLWGIELTCRFSLRGKSRSHSTNRKNTTLMLHIRCMIFFPLYNGREIVIGRTVK